MEKALKGIPWWGYAIIVFIALCIYGGWANEARDKRLVEEMRAKDPAAFERAVQEARADRIFRDMEWKAAAQKKEMEHAAQLHLDNQY